MGKLDAANAAKAKGRGRVNPFAAALAKADGHTPLEVMLATMRTLVADADVAKTPATRRRLMSQASGIAKDAAPYIHPKLSSIEHKGKVELGFAERLVKARERCSR